MIQNIVVGSPLVEPWQLLAKDYDDWIEEERELTFFTNERNLPAILKEIGIVPSINEVRRNKPKLMVTLDKLDCFWVKWGKNKVYIVVGE